MKKRTRYSTNRKRNEGMKQTRIIRIVRIVLLLTIVILRIHELLSSTHQILHAKPLVVAVVAIIPIIPIIPYEHISHAHKSIHEFRI